MRSIERVIVKGWSGEGSDVKLFMSDGSDVIVSAREFTIAWRDSLERPDTTNYLMESLTRLAERTHGINVHLDPRWERICEADGDGEFA